VVGEMSVNTSKQTKEINTSLKKAIIINQVNMKITADKKTQPPRPTVLSSYLMYNFSRLKRPLQELTRNSIMQRKDLYRIYSRTDTHVK
jgi:RecA/RadA recombinase